jgi:dCTP deaminase
VIASDATLRTLVPGSDPGPASIDVHLGDVLLTASRGLVLDPEADQSNEYRAVNLAWDQRWHLEPLHGYLGVTREKITVPNGWAAVLDGISSLARLWLTIHVTGGYVDPGWTDTPITLEIVPLSNPILLRPGMRVGQVRYVQMTGLSQRPYAGRYVGSGALPVTSRAYKDVAP